MLDCLIYITTSLIIVTKIPDLHSTLSRITHINQEKNPLGRYFMRKWGMKTGLIIATGIFFLLVIISAAIVLILDIAIFKVFYILNAILFSILNLAVAHQNYTGKSNKLTKLIKRITGNYYS